MINVAAMNTASSPSEPLTSIRSPFSSSISRSLFVHNVHQYLSRLSESPFSRKILRNVRLFILVLGFVTLILDAITLSFESNVMNLEFTDISTQAALLLTPDLLAMMMALMLLIYASNMSCCCFNTMAPDNDIGNNNEGEEVRVDFSENPQESSPAPTAATAATADRQVIGESEHQPNLEHSSDQYWPLQKREQRDTLEEEESIRQRRTKDHVGIEHQSVMPAPVITVTPPTDQILSSVTNAQSLTTESSVESQISDPITNSAPHSLIPSSSNELIKITTTAEKELYLYKERRRRVVLTLYIISRVIFSLGLVALALYWPAGQMKPPVGYLPNLDEPMYPHHRSDTSTSSSITEALSKRRIDNFNSSAKKLLIKRALPTRIIPEYPLENFRSLNRLAVTREENKLHEKSDDVANNNSKGLQSKHWCALEQAFGDNQSAKVYCQVNTIRPGVTYGWVGLVIVELCLAFAVGDLNLNKRHLLLRRADQLVNQGLGNESAQVLEQEVNQIPIFNDNS
ncbi:hypothetical protein BX616_010642 [Lobosporangium transversale]|uniref:Transmembrane protein n=1 Tax=Lobosporangium transversale TaxID=64571 RepID=A0A1Y2G8L5_9FUNG|nr:hypothetical protein BCR41DRAFT_402111 [Lobosporangium transversale]KAF9918001.1 hypothetical protein BX616_010642 [Lobosporangium transversale]ORY96994.1 hypothetical protein BCR41DRAFT_402111 [Lobosporangium transversale]|eukprot:XP_021875556.1 hypothetical protein BCR41DRAFT_402111 [Lobosporangium transversale]